MLTLDLILQQSILNRAARYCLYLKSLEDELEKEVSNDSLEDGLEKEISNDSLEDEFIEICTLHRLYTNVQETLKENVVNQ